jgi:Bifunctional DNA primase/polymerase, N-terminal
MNKFQEVQAISGLQIIPVNNKKVPTIAGWQKSTEAHNLDNCYGIGLVCGAISGGVEVLDFDLKYSIDPSLFDKWKRDVSKVAPELLKKMVVQTTVSSGYHLIYRCSIIEGNKKLASRNATEEEKKTGDKVKILIETRGEGGYICAAPSPGYKLIYGSWDKIQTITPEEREILLNTARDFNEVFKEYIPPKTQAPKQIKGLTPFEDFNNRGDWFGLLVKHGWQPVGTKGRKTLFKRPGQTSASHSGNFDTDKNWFSVFTTSSQFETERSYLPYAVYAVLECNGDFSEASRRLYEEGYGDRFEAAKEQDLHVPSRISATDDDYSFLVTDDDISDYMSKARAGKLTRGKTTGIPTLDKHFLFKDNSLVVINGLDNTGKTSMMLYLALLSAIHNEWNWIIYSSENGHGSLVRRLIELYWCEPIDKINDLKYEKAKQFVNKHFAIIKSDEQLFNYKDILTMSSKLMKLKTYNSVLIDPYNSLKIDMPVGYKLSTHDYHYEAISEIKLWTKHNCCVYINTHPHTEAGRNLIEVEQADGSKLKLTAAPRKSDSEGGNKFPNKADDFLTIHRYVDSPDSWMFTELHVRKIKEMETGGKVTPVNQPVRLRMIANQCGFEDEYGNNAILNYHSKQPEQYVFKPLVERRIEDDNWETESKIY